MLTVLLQIFSVNNAVTNMIALRNALYIRKITLHARKVLFKTIHNAVQMLLQETVSQKHLQMIFLPKWIQNPLSPSFKVSRIMKIWSFFDPLIFSSMHLRKTIIYPYQRKLGNHSFREMPDTTLLLRFCSYNSLLLFMSHLRLFSNLLRHIHTYCCYCTHNWLFAR